MREKNLKTYTILYLISMGVIGCTNYNNARPRGLTYYTPEIKRAYPQTKPIANPPQQTLNTNINTNAIPQSQPQYEDVIEEETLFIPSALRHTPEYEIEIVAPNEIKQEEKVIIEEIELPPTPEKKIKIKKGDTLYSIAKSENIPVYELADYNKLTAPFTLKLGQIISIPSMPPKTATKTIEKTTEVITNLDDNKTFIEEPKVDYVIIQKGDTIYSIAKKNNVPLKDIIIRNNLTPPYTLSIGQKIYIPNTAFHIVQKEDTVYSISRKYNVNLNSLVKLNNLKEPYTIVPGQKITLPASNINIELTKEEKEKTEENKQQNIKKLEKTTSKTPTKQTTPQKPKEEEIKKTSPMTQKETKEKVDKIIIKPAPLTSKKFMWPTNGKVISKFGIKNNGKRNDGINISAPLGTSVKAVENGIIAYAGNELKGLGNLIIIKHDKDYMTIYAHNKDLKVKKGDIVKRGDIIATVGKTGRVTSSQLHFEVRKKTQSIDPLTILEKK